MNISIIDLPRLLSLIFLVGFSQQVVGQKLVLDTVIKTDINEDYGDVLQFQIWQDSLFLYALKERDSSFMHTKNLLNSSKTRYFRTSIILPFQRFITKHEEDMLVANTQYATILKEELDSTVSKQKLNDELFRQVYANSELAISLETYPDFFRPKSQVRIRYGPNIFNLSESHDFHFDFPHYLARVGQLFSLNKNKLFYCNTLDYSCYEYDTHTKETTLIIKDSLNSSSMNSTIEKFKEEIFSGNQQPNYWIPKLKKFDEQVHRITKVFYSDSLILVFKRAPGSKFDYRLLDVYTKVDEKWKVNLKDIKISRWPNGTISYNNPPFEIMDSYPATLFENKLYILCKKDYIDGLKEGTPTEEFRNNQNNYYEVNDNYYSVFVYSIRQASSD